MSSSLLPRYGLLVLKVPIIAATFLRSTAPDDTRIIIIEHKFINIDDLVVDCWLGDCGDCVGLAFFGDSATTSWRSSVGWTGLPRFLAVGSCLLITQRRWLQKLPILDPGIAFDTGLLVVDDTDGDDGEDDNK